MSEKSLMKNDIQERLRGVVREKFQDLLSDADLNNFVQGVVNDWTKDIQKHTEAILAEEMKEYVRKYLKEISATEWEGNNVHYNKTITEGIEKAIPMVFERLLANFVSNAVSSYAQNGTFNY